MKPANTVYFKDESFPITIRAARSSYVGPIDEASTALHEAIEIKYFYEGSATLFIGENTVSAGAGDVVVINPYEFHSTISCDSENHGKYHLFMIGLDFFERSRGADVDLRHILLGKQTIFKTLHQGNERLREVLTKIVEEKECWDEYSRLAIFGLVGELISILLRCGTDTAKTPPSEDMIHRYTTIEPAIRNIRDNYQKSFSIDGLSKLCTVSKYHFCRIFKEVMGMSAIQYINYYRLKIADAMLQNSDKSINEIAETVGFEDASYFSKLYKKTFGASPKSTKRKT